MITGESGLKSDTCCRHVGLFEIKDRKHGVKSFPIETPWNTGLCGKIKTGIFPFVFQYDSFRKL